MYYTLNFCYNSWYTLFIAIQRVFLLREVSQVIFSQILCKEDAEYIRNGTANIMLAIEPHTGKIHIEITEHRTRKDYARFMDKVVNEFWPDATKRIIVQDNLNTHSSASFYETFHPEKASSLKKSIECCYTPKHGSWLNCAEIGHSIFHIQCLGRRIGSFALLRSEAKAWEIAHNANLHSTKWHFTTANARVKLRRLYPVIE